MYLKSKFKSIGKFQKRGIIYITIASFGILYEIMFHRPIRTTVMFLWFGLIIIAIGIIFTLKENENKS